MNLNFILLLVALLLGIGYVFYKNKTPPIVEPSVGKNTKIVSFLIGFILFPSASLILDWVLFQIINVGGDGADPFVGLLIFPMGFIGSFVLTRLLVSSGQGRYYWYGLLSAFVCMGLFEYIVILHP